MPASLSPRDRVLRSIARRDIDRIPTMFRAEPELIAILRRHFGTDDLDSFFGSDLVFAQQGCPQDRLPDMSAMEEAADVDRVAWPDRTILDMGATERRLGDARDTGCAVCGGMWASIFTHSRRVMGEARYLVSMYENPELIRRVVERLTDAFLDMNEAVFGRCADLIDIFYFGSDFGTQASLFVSPDLYRQFFKPQMRRLVEHAKGHDLSVMFHTCGAVAPIIDDLIDIGVDTLDPVQVSATGMEPAALAERFKGRIAFHGGISSQVTIPRGTPGDIRAEVAAAIEALGPLGYICAPDQNMMEDTPPENVAALYRAIRNYRLS